MLLSEICDRSFIMVTIFATKLNKFGVFIVGSTLMTMLQILAVIIGQIFPFLLQQNLTHIIAVFLFFAFGFYMLYCAFFKTQNLMNPEEEEREILDEIANKEALNQPLMTGDSESQIVQSTSFKGKKESTLNKYIMFGAMLCCGEFGDKSQITAIVLAATYNPYSVVIGGSLALMVCVFLAIVLG
mmetsp:Transcript_1992/g.1898  ORF Transcript_1992/g.1898 Transcript_1992/m.1898 type:complete len:185 (-) Transcript_1992:142-696(-)